MCHLSTSIEPSYRACLRIEPPAGREGAINLLRHTWASTFYDEVAARYDRGAINAKERKAVYEQLCRLMCHSPAAAKKYLNRVKRGDPSPIAGDWLDGFVRSRRDDA